MKKLLILLLILICSAVSYPAEKTTDDDVKIKMLHIFIKADVNEVRFENLYVYRRQKIDTLWQVNINIPENVSLEQENDPNTQQNPQYITKDLNKDSLIDSASFTYFKPNENGKCSLKLNTARDIDSLIVYVSGRETTLKSNLLKFNSYRAIRSRYSGVYTAENISADKTVHINLSALPKAEDMLVEYVSLCSLALIVMLALIILIVSKLKFKN